MTNIVNPQAVCQNYNAAHQCSQLIPKVRSTDLPSVDWVSEYLDHVHWLLLGYHLELVLPDATKGKIS